MCACAATLLLLAALPALTGRADGELVSVVLGAAGGEGGAGPAFVAGQRTTVLAPVGHAATLECRVLRLHDQSVSWVRSRDLQILSHAGAVFTADARVSASASAGGSASASAPGPGRHSLHIERLRTDDAGRYECQVNTEPKMSLFFNLTVVDEPVPAVLVTVLGAAVQRGVRGGAATLACQARYQPAPRDLPLPPLSLRWQRGDQPIDLQSGRGGVALDTQRWAARVESRLTLAELSPHDAGTYTCSAGGKSATLTLYLDDEVAGDHAEAMQRDEAEGAAQAPRAGATLPTTLAAALALLALR